LVVIEIGSQARFTFSLMLICLVYFGVFQTFLPEYCVFFVDVFFKFIMEHF
jgi:hypothetical protein